jgi:hypothetical protein
LDGVSLLPVLRGALDARSEPLGFWTYPTKGRAVHSTRILRQLADAQQAGRLPPLEPRPRIARHPREADLPGHAAWVDGDFKLHRIPGKDGDVRFELFDLRADPAETDDLAESDPDRVERMRMALEGWQRSVLRDLDATAARKR